MKRIIAATIAILMLALVCFTGCGSQSGSLQAIKKEDLKVAFLYVGTIGDLGYSYAHDHGVLLAVYLSARPRLRRADFHHIYYSTLFPDLKHLSQRF